MPEGVLANIDSVKRGLITKAVNQGILLAKAPEVVVQELTEKFDITTELAWDVYNRQSVYATDALAERSKLLGKERHTQRGMMLARLEYTYAQAHADGDTKTALQCLKMIGDLLDLKYKAGTPKNKPIKTTAETKPTAYTDEELAELAKKGIPT